MNTRPFDAIIFDHDGTLIDTETSDFQAWELLYQEFGATISLEYWADVAVGHMNGYDTLFAGLLHQNGNEKIAVAALKSRLKELWTLTLETVELMPGAENLLDQLQTADYPLAVASASDRQWLTRWLTHFNLHSYFQVVASSDDVANSKPAPDVYLLAAAQLGVAADRCLVFEDSLAGLQAAKAAGMTVVAVPNHVTKSLNFSQADFVIPGLHEVTIEWLETLETPKRPKP